MIGQLASLHFHSLHFCGAGLFFNMRKNSKMLSYSSRGLPRSAVCSSTFRSTTLMFYYRLLLQVKTRANVQLLRGEDGRYFSVQ